MSRMTWWQPTAVACVVAVALVAGGLVFAPSAGADPVLPEASLTWEDGHNHFIVAPGATAEPTSTVAAGPDASYVDVHSPDGTPMALLTDGRIVAKPTAKSSDPSEPSVVTPVIEGGVASRSFSESFARQLSEQPGIIEATPMYGGLVAVTTDLDAGELSDIDGVATVTEDVLLQLGAVQQGTPNDPLFGSQWMHRNTGSASQAGGHSGVSGADAATPEAWPSTTGAGVVVADIDSGVQTDHPDLAGRIWRNAAEVCGNGSDDDRNGYTDDCTGWDFGANDNNPYPDGTGGFGAHGTHVAGIIAASADNNTGIVGMAPDASVMALKASSGNNLSTSALISSVYYAVDNGADVINASWGTSPGAYSRTDVQFMEQAVSYAHSRGVVFVAAAGNDNVNIDYQQQWPASFSVFYDNVITVGASTNSDTRAYFSNYGTTTVDITAPGWFINSTVPGSGWATMSGTSMAAPCVAGAAALVLSGNTSMSPSDVRTRLAESSEPIQTLTGIAKAGRLNAALAVERPDLGVVFNGLDTARPDQTFNAEAVITAGDSSVPSTMRSASLHVATLESGYVYAVADLSIGLNASTVVTDEYGTAALGVVPWSGESAIVDLELKMPAGDYAFVMTLDDGAGTTTNASVVYFSVAAAGSPSPQPSNPGTGSGGGSSGGGSSGGGTPGAPRNGSGVGAPAPGQPGGGTGGSVSPAPGSGTSNPGTPATGSGPGSGTSPGPAPLPAPAPAPSPSPAPAPGLPPGGTPPPSGSAPPRAPAPAPAPQPPAPKPAPAPQQPGQGSSQPAPPADPAPVESNGWRIDLVRPRSGPASGGTLVHITGTFPDPASAYVDFGGQPATIAWTSTFGILAWAPAHAPGVVDLTVRGNGAHVTMPAVYTYVPVEQSPGDTGSGSTPPPGGSKSPGSGTPGGGSSGGGGTPGSPSTPGAPGGGGGSGGGEQGGVGGPPSAPAPPSQVQRGELRLLRPQSGSVVSGLDASAWASAICRNSSCVGRTI